MKTFLLSLLAVFLSCCLVQSQTEYFYPLTSGFRAVQIGAPELIQIHNDEGDSGAFVVRPIPATTCGSQGQAPGYFFADDAGLQFNDPAGFIDQAYSLALNFQIDEFITPPSWVRLLSFTHTDDVGLYILLTDPPNHGTLEFWPYGTVGQDNFFSPVDFYQMILVRSSAGMITVYINGQEFAQYDDSSTQAYVPNEPSNFIVFFRDHPSVLAGEASPGFVSSIRITNTSWSFAEVQTLWNQFCSSLMGITESPGATTLVFPNPAHHQLFIERPTAEKAAYCITDLSGRQHLSGIAMGQKSEVPVSELRSGMYWIRLEDARGPVVLKFIKD
jgi:hypothetical protein